MPKINKADFLALRNKYKIGIITDGSCFESKVAKIKNSYGVDIDGYIHHTQNIPKKPNASMYHEFCKMYHVEQKPIAYIGDSIDLDGGMAKNVNLDFIHVNPAQSTIDMEKLTKELTIAEEKRNLAMKRWAYLLNLVRDKSKTEKSESVATPTNTSVMKQGLLRQ
jgi:FMN phosphatase YigB (HAD superfamily)